MEDEIFFLTDKGEDFLKIKPGERIQTVMFHTIYRTGSIEKPDDYT
jgi:hypothetical protein